MPAYYYFFSGFPAKLDMISGIYMLHNFFSPTKAKIDIFSTQVYWYFQRFKTWRFLKMTSTGLCHEFKRAMEWASYLRVNNNLEGTSKLCVPICYDWICEDFKTSPLEGVMSLQYLPYYIFTLDIYAHSFFSWKKRKSWRNNFGKLKNPGQNY